MRGYLKTKGSRALAMLMCVMMVLSMIPSCAFSYDLPEGYNKSQEYSVQYELTHISEENLPKTTSGSSIHAVLKADEGYVLPDTIAVTISGSAIIAGENFSYSKDTGCVDIPDVEGDVVIKAHALAAATLIFNGRGTKEDPYLIKNDKDLKALADIVNSGDFKSDEFTYFKQTDNISLEGISWTPIGTASHPFYANYDGGGFDITGLFIETDFQYVGLFGNIYEVEEDPLKEVKLSNINIVSPKIVSKSKNVEEIFVGALTGYAQNASISNCSIQGGSIVHEGSNNSHVGALAGRIFIQRNHGNVNSCYSTASVEGNCENAGGLIGNVIASPGTISNCYSTGNVKGTKNAGGLFGTLSGPTINNSFAAGEVSSSSSAGLGGLAGRITGTNSILTNNISFNKSVDIENNSLQSENIGRIVGLFVTHRKHKNYSLSTMLVDGAFISGTVNDKNGLNKSLSELKDKKTWDALNFDFTNSWDWNEDLNCPILKGMKGQNTSPYPDINIPLTISRQPQSLILFEGDKAEFSISASGDIDTLSYSWQQSNDGENWTNIDEAVSNKYIIEKIEKSMDGNLCRCVVKDKTGELISDSAKISVAFGGGEGTQQSPYLISTVDDLKKLAQDLKDKTRSYTGIFFEQTCDINLACTEDNQWTPIGSFDGIYDGKNYTISGLLIKDALTDSCGLFGHTFNAVIKNLTLISPTISSSSSNIGGIVGWATNTTITCCSVQGGSIRKTGNSNGVSDAGAIAGRITLDKENKYFEDKNKYVLENCYADIEITGVGDEIGGIAGGVYVGAGFNIIIRNNYSSGKISGLKKQVGGILGYGFGNINIENSYSAAYIYTNSNQCIGGIIGQIESSNVSVSDCAAVNKAIKPSADNLSSDTTGRIAGEFAGGKNNYALDSMLVNNKTVTDGTLASKDGLNKSIDEFKNKGTWDKLNFDFENTWQWDETLKYPKLRNIPNQTSSPFEKEEGTPLFVLSIYKQPERKITFDGRTARFDITASGIDLKYQWQVSSDGGNIWNDINGETSSSCTVSAEKSMDGNKYRCVISDSFGESMASIEVLLSVEDGSYDNAGEAKKIINYYKSEYGRKSILDTVKDPVSLYSYNKDLSDFRVDLKYYDCYLGSGSEFEGPSEGFAALDYMVQGKNPQKYLRNKSASDTNTEEADLIDEILALQDGETGELASALANNQNQIHIVQLLALESFFEGKPWGNEKKGTKLGRSGAIEYLLNSLKEDEKSVGLYYNSISEGNCDYMRAQCKLVILLSKLSNGSDYKDKATEAMNRVLKTLNYYYEKNEKVSDVKFISKYISALVAANSVANDFEKINDNVKRIYELFDLLRYAKTDKNSYASSTTTQNIPSTSDAKSTASVMMAFGDFINGRAIYAEIKNTSDDVLTDEEIVKKDLDSLTIEEKVKQNISLPLSGKYGSSIVWSSNNTDAITSDGKVTRLKDETQVILTAVLIKGDATARKEFTVIVEAERNADADAVKDDVALLEIPSEAINDLSLPIDGKNGSKIAWSSSDASIIDAMGKITRPAAGEPDAKVTLTAVVSKGEYSESIEFEITVYAVSDNLNEGYYAIREYYLKNKNLSGDYWETYAAYSVLEDSIQNNGYSFFDVTKHKERESWQATDYGAVVLQLIANGSNPYNYKGRNYAEGLLNVNSGGYGNPIWKAMGIISTGEDKSLDNLVNYCKGQLTSLEYGPDLAGWSLVVLANYPDREDIKEAVYKFRDEMKASQVQSGEYKSLFSVGGMGSGSSLSMSTSCVLTGFAALRDAGFEGFDPTDDYWKVDGVSPIDTLYELGIEGKVKCNVQIAIAFGDTYHKSSAWSRIGITRDDLSDIIARSEAIDKTKYTSNSISAMTKALESAKSLPIKGAFGKEYFTLRDAVSNLVKSGTAQIKIFGNTDKPVVLNETPYTDITKSTIIEEAVKNVLDSSNIKYELSGGTIQSISELKSSDNTEWYAYLNGNRALLSDKIKEGDLVVLKYCDDVISLNKNAQDNTLASHLVYEDTRNLNIPGDINNVTGNLILNGKGIYGSVISWQSSNESIVPINGSVNRLKSNAQVKLNATVSYGDKTSVKEFTVIIIGTEVDNPTVENITVSFKLLGVEKHGGKGKIHVYKEDPSSFQVWISERKVTVPVGSTVKDVFEKVLDEIGMPYINSTGNYVSSINGLAEFDNGQNSGWMYLINGTNAKVGLKMYTLEDKDKIVWHYTDEYTKEEGSEKWNTDSPNTEGDETIVKAEIDKDGMIAKAEVEFKKDMGKLKVESSIANISFDVDTINELLKNKDSNKIIISMSKTDNKEIEKVLPGITRPIVHVGVTVGKEEIKELKDGKITVTIPYKLNDGESKEKLIIYALDENNNLKVVKKVSYDDKSASISFETNELTSYAVGYEQFEDITDHWAYESIHNATARGLFNGTSEDNFSPEAKTTRAMFVTVLSRLAKAEKSDYGINFDDIDDDAWYKNAVAWAESNDIVKGVTDKEFGFDNEITREQIAVILARYIEKSRIAIPLDSNESITYSDNNQISDWATDSISFMQKTGLMTGKNGNMFDPKAAATRAEISVILNRLLEFDK